MAAVDWAIAQGSSTSAPRRDRRLLRRLHDQLGHQPHDPLRGGRHQRCFSNMYSTSARTTSSSPRPTQTIGGRPWEEPDIYWDLSPITYVDQIETPPLIEHQEQDYRCPVEQAEQLFTALKRRGKIVEIVRYPDESHGMSRTGQPKHRIERLDSSSAGSSDTCDGSRRDGHGARVQPHSLASCPSRVPRLTSRHASTTIAVRTPWAGRWGLRWETPWRGC